MEEQKEQQYLTELLFDTSGISAQFEGINKLLINEGTTLKNLMSKNWNIGDFLKEQMQQAQASVDKETKKMQTSWANAYRILRSQGDPMADVSQLLKGVGKNAQKVAVVWTEEMEKEFRTRMPELKSQLSDWIRWVGEGEGQYFDGQLSNSIADIAPQFGKYENQMEFLEKLNEGLQRYKASARQIVETGSFFSDEVSESERLRAAYDALTGKAREYYRVRKDAFTPGEAESAGFDDTYRYLEQCASEAVKLADTEAKINVRLNESNEIQKASITYTDQQGRKVEEIYGWYQKLNVLTGEVEHSFGQIGSNVIDDKLARAAASTKEMEQNARQFQTAYEQTVKLIAQSSAYMQVNHMDPQKLQIAKSIAVETEKLRSENYDISKEVLLQMQSLREQAKEIDRIVQADKERKAIAAAEKAEREKVLSVNKEIANVQKKIRNTRNSDSSLAREADILREQSNALVNQLNISGKLTAEDRERLKVLDEQLSKIKTQASTMAADAAGPTSTQQGILKSSAKWFSAYQVWHETIELGKQTVLTMKDVEASVTEVSRVIDDASFNFNQFTSDVFKIAEDYGRDFNDTIDISTRFAQAGYNVRETLSMTKDSLLALNTAELDAKNATQSLIGILQQWGMGADDMLGVIDRVNKVADNYAITSQDLVDALLKSSSMAKQANMSFEETVGVLTAMKTASGAAGREVGNAFKSILAFIQRPQSLKGFEGMGIDVFADKVTGKLNPMTDILQQMADKWNSGSKQMQDAFMDAADQAGLFSEEMAIATGTQNEFAAASQEANDAERRGQANLSAGVYRRNYYTALMENFAQVQKVVATQTDAEGYSMRENAKYMNTLEAKTRTFITALKEMATAAGKNGLMDLAKNLLNIATWLAKVSKHAAFLPVAIGWVVAAMNLLGKQTDILGTKEMTFAALKAAIKGMTVETVKARIASAALQATMSVGLSLAIQALITIMGKLTENTESATDAINEMHNATEQSIESARQAATSRQAELDIAAEYIQRLKDMQDSEEGLASRKGETLLLIQKVNEILPEANLLYDEQKNVINGLNDSLYQNIDAMRAQAEAELNFEQLKAYIEEQREAKRILDEQIAAREEYNQKVKENMFVDEYGASRSSYDMYGFGDTRLVEDMRAAQQAYDEAKKKVEDFQAQIGESNQFLEQMAGNVAAVASESESVVTAWADSFKNVDVSTIESNIEKLTSAIEKLNNGLLLSQDEMLELAGISPDIVTGLRQVGDQYYFIDGALEKALGSQQNYRAEVELSKVAVEYLKGATDEQKDALMLAVQGLQNASSETERFTALTKTAISVLGGFKSGLGNFVSNAANLIKNGLNIVKDLLGQADKNINVSPSTPSYGGGGGGSSGGKSEAEKARDEAKKEADRLIKELERKRKEKVAAIDDEIKALRKRSEAEQKSYEQEIKHLQKIKEARKKEYDEQIKQIRKKYDEEIKALKDLEQERDRARERADLQEELEYWKKRTGVEAVEKIAELEKQLERKEEDWKSDDQIQKLEELRDAEIERLEAARDAMEERYDAEIERVQEAKEAAKDAADARLETLQDEKEQVQENYQNQIEYLREVSSDSDSTAAQILQAIDDVRNGTITDVESVGKAIDNLAIRAKKAFDEIGKGDEKSPANTGKYDGKSPANTGRFTIPKSHTGSEVVQGGLVNVAPAEIIVNPEISNGLRRLIQKLGLSSRSSHTFSQQTTDSHNKTVQINSPLYFVQHQEINDVSDATITEHDVDRMLHKAVATLR